MCKINFVRIENTLMRYFSQIYQSVCAFEFRSIDSERRKLIGQNSWLCLFRNMIGWERSNKVRHFLHMKTIPFFKTKQQLCSGVFTKNLKWCLPREGQGFAQNITGKRKRVPQIHQDTTRVRAYRVFLPRDWPAFSNGNVCFRERVCNGRF